MAKQPAKTPVAKTTTPTTVDKEKAKLAKEAKQLDNQNKALIAIRRTLKNTNESARLELLAPLGIKIPKAVFDEEVANKTMTQKEVDWLSANTEIMKAGRKSSGGGTREKVVRLYPKAFIAYDEKEGDKCTDADKKMITHGTEFQENLKQFMVDNEAHFDYFESKGQFWKTYFRADEPVVAK